MNTDQLAKKSISVVVDTPGWFDPFAKSLSDILCQQGHRAKFVRNYAEVDEGDIAFFLSCTRITPISILSRNEWNLVVHASDLPKGRGFSPLVWQILEGVNEIPVTMILMAEEVDAGDIVMQRQLKFQGHELNKEMRAKLGQSIVEMCVDFVKIPTPPARRIQAGAPSWYRRRHPQDSRIDPLKTIDSQFELFRVVDNDSYPAFFDYRGHRFIVRIDDAGKIPVETDQKKS